MDEQDFLKQTATIFCQDPKIRENQDLKQRMNLYDSMLCKTLGINYPIHQNNNNNDNNYFQLPKSNTLVDSFIKNLMNSDQNLISSYQKIQQNSQQKSTFQYHPQSNQTQYQSNQLYSNDQVHSQQIQYQQQIQQHNNHSKINNNYYKPIYKFDIIEESKKRRIERQLKNI